MPDNKTILIVDDNDAARYANSRILSREGFNIIEASTGRECLEQAARRPVLIILDVRLPDMSGLEVCRRLKSDPHTASIPVLQISANLTSSDDKSKGFQSGADGYLMQPVEPVELISNVRTLLRLRRAEEETRTSSRQWQTIFNAVSDGVALIDLSGRIVRCNQAFEQITGRPSTSLTDSDYREVLGIDQEGHSLLSRLLETQQRVAVDFKLDERWFRITLDPMTDEMGTRIMAAILIVSDITERKRVELELSSVKDELAMQLLDMTQLHELGARLSTYVDLEQVLNEVLAAVTELERTDMGVLMLYDRERDDLYTVASLGFDSDYLNSIGRVARGMGACGTAIAERRHVIVEDTEQDATFSHYREAARQAGYRSVYSLPMLTGKGEILGTISTYFRTIYRPTEREMRLVEMYARQAAQVIENARLYREAQEANRLKDEFLATVSHELRTPLTAMLGWTRLVRSGKLDPMSFDRALEIIERNAKSQAQLIEDLLDISRIITGKLRLEVGQVNITGVVEAAINVVRPAADAKAINMRAIIDSDVGLVTGDAGRLQQVVWNLLSNAVKFTPEGGYVEVRLATVNSHVRITVNDTGRGITPEFLPYVFDRFRQADSTSTRSHGGLGLGLAIVRHLVELHGGTISAESAGEGKGSSFTVTLPRVAVVGENNVLTAVSAGDSGSFDSLPSLTGVDVLVVDDEADSREMLATVLSGNGANVRTAQSAAEALALIDERVPDVLVSDIAMPSENGYELIRKLRMRAPTRGGRVPAAALTAYARAEDRRRALLSGFQVHVPKPIEPAELIAVVASLAGRTGDYSPQRHRE